MNWLDTITQKTTRTVARKSSRRGFLAGVTTLLLGATALPLLPVARASSAHGEGQGHGNSRVLAQSTGNPEDPGDPTQCDYWRYCAIDGFLCSCCGGSQSACPPGTEMSPLTWIGTCRNPADGKNYVVSYNDCCGKSSCGRCLCNSNESDRPVYRPSANNDINWCMGTSSATYHCSTSVILGLASS